MFLLAVASATCTFSGAYDVDFAGKTAKSATGAYYTHDSKDVVNVYLGDKLADHTDKRGLVINFNPCTPSKELGCPETTPALDGTYPMHALRTITDLPTLHPRTAVAIASPYRTSTLHFVNLNLGLQTKIILGFAWKFISSA